MKQEEWRERERIYACWLCNFPDIGNKQLHRLSQLCGGPEAVYLADKGKWGEVLSPKQVESLARYTAVWKPEAEYRKMKEEGIEVLTVGDERYPERLRRIPDAPYGLFVRGKLPQPDAPAVAVIGSRECSEYGRYVAKVLGGFLGQRGVTVISGMARGIDGIGQEAALEAGGYSVGVLGSGADICYPAQNRGLYEKLIKSGAVLSSYPLGTPARPQNFPPRNRIVSGLADAVVVVEARAKSGTLITVDMALEQGREVYVVPGRVTDRLSDGCNRLVKQGAGVVLGPESFFEEIRQLWETGKKTSPKAAEQPNTFLEQTQIPGLPKEQAEVWGALDFEPKSPEEIRGQLSDKYPEKQIVTCLMQLCMENLAVQVSPGRFILRKITT
ncbi:MAG: DNA-protecting protein DprA [Lachnospiraceae bacterium]|nr:DNA-protecting protein DprA [Lachnospiraceae bacterium]